MKNILNSESELNLFTPGKHLLIKWNRLNVKEKLNVYTPEQNHLKVIKIGINFK